MRMTAGGSGRLLLPGGALALRRGSGSPCNGPERVAARERADDESGRSAPCSGNGSGTPAAAADDVILETVVMETLHENGSGSIA
uniref:Uncharacterized protein n=1 Tax=Ralstonia solanacearum CFBP2957 TaxID=859656 RepID=D8P5L6_RALSL|nr:protein of unknown function [Ralstonia solanacearum CFBP2957]